VYGAGRDIVEELQQLLDGWLTSDHDKLDTSLTQFIGNRAYDIIELRQDLSRFSFLCWLSRPDDLEVERGGVRIVEHLVDEDGLVLTEGAFPVGVSGLVGVLEGVAGRLG
jgi:hypothetical protein